MDFQQFSWSIGGNSSRTLPDVNVNLQVTDSQTGVVFKDFTGANAFNIWVVFSSLSATDKKDVLDGFIRDIIRKKAGF